MLSNGISASAGLQCSQDSDQFLGFAERRRVDQDDVLLFGCWIEEVEELRHGADSITAG